MIKTEKWKVLSTFMNRRGRGEISGALDNEKSCESKKFWSQKRVRSHTSSKTRNWIVWFHVNKRKRLKKKNHYRDIMEWAIKQWPPGWQQPLLMSPPPLATPQQQLFTFHLLFHYFSAQVSKWEQYCYLTKTKKSDYIQKYFENLLSG